MYETDSNRPRNVSRFNFTMMFLECCYMNLCDHSLVYYVSTGFGDRCLDMCGLAVLREALGCRDANVVFTEQEGTWWGSYDTVLFRAAPVKVSTAIPCVSNLLRVEGSPGGSLHPTKIVKLLKRYNIRSSLPEDRYWQCFLSHAERLEPSLLIDEHIPANMNEAVGIHLRKSDKVLDDSPQHGTTTKEFHDIIAALKSDVTERIREGQRTFFICSEDPLWRSEFEVWLLGIKSDAVILKPGKASSVLQNISGVDAVLDFFCLARCKIILQGIGYSTFSMAASLVAGRVPLVNYSSEVRSSMYLLNWWAPALNLISRFDGAGNDSCDPYVTEIICRIDCTSTFNQSASVISYDVRMPDKVFKPIFKPIIYRRVQNHIITKQ